MNPIIVPISGKARHGKDTFAEHLTDYLYEEHYFKIQKLAYARDVKELAREHGWNGEKDHNGVALLQTIGQQGRNFDKEIWIKRLEPRIDREADFVLITDTRYPNEITYWENRDYSSINVRIERLRPDGELFGGLPAELACHKSETALDDYDFDLNYKCKELESLENAAEGFAEILIDKHERFLEYQKEGSIKEYVRRKGEYLTEKMKNLDK